MIELNEAVEFYKKQDIFPRKLEIMCSLRALSEDATPKYVGVNLILQTVDSRRSLGSGGTRFIQAAKILTSSWSRSHSFSLTLWQFTPRFYHHLSSYMCCIRITYNLSTNYLLLPKSAKNRCFVKENTSATYFRVYQTKFVCI